MLTLYIQTCSKEDSPVEGEPAWTNPFASSIFGIYVQGEEGTVPRAYVNACGREVSIPIVEAYSCQNEAEVLAKFWDHLKRGPTESLLTYNGRKFTVPFLYIRSALNGVEIGNPDLLRERYKIGIHIDVADALTFHGILPKPSFSQVAGLLKLEMPSLKEGESLQKLLRNALEQPDPALAQLLAQNGLEYVNLIDRIGRFWRKSLKAAF